MDITRQSDSKTKLLNAALDVIRTKGYSDTSVDDICRKAGVTKGSFFHHFKTKDDLALAAVAHWNTTTSAFFAAAPYHQPEDPLERVFGYVDFRAAILTGEIPEYTCFFGTLVQEIYATHPDIRAACENGFASHIAKLTEDIEGAKQRYAISASWSAESLATFIQSVLQGSFIFAKAKQSSEVARENLEHLRRYLDALFPRETHIKENQ